MDIQFLEKLARQVRRDIITMVSKAGAGHPGGSLSCTDALVAVYFEVMNVSPENENIMRSALESSGAVYSMIGELTKESGKMS